MLLVFQHPLWLDLVVTVQRSQWVLLFWDLLRLRLRSLPRLGPQIAQWPRWPSPPRGRGGNVLNGLFSSMLTMYTPHAGRLRVLHTQRVVRSLGEGLLYTTSALPGIQ